MGFSNPDSGCRRHPNQKQLPGVCSVCLRERLSRLSSQNKTSTSSFSDSSSSSPPSLHHRRNGSAAAAPGDGGQGDVSAGLKKSRSVAWAPRSFRLSGEKEDKSGGKKGLWKKLVNSTSKKTKGVLMHSMTTIKERSHDANSYRRF